MQEAIIFDCETTGGEPLEIIELAAINLLGEPLVNRRYKPEGAITLGAMCTHNIIPSDLEGWEPSSKAAGDLPQAEYLIGHNVDYDWEACGKPPGKRICTLALSRRLWPSLDCHKLTALIYHIHRADLQIARERVCNAHSAIDDCLMTNSLLVVLMNGFAVKDMESLYQLSEDARVPDVMPFGKHKGLPMSEVPSDYKRWLLNQPDVDPYLAKALRGEQ